MIGYFFFFFFSSRRRHTRCSRDWSSDVCSSDLLLAEVDVLVDGGLERRRSERHLFLRQEIAIPRLHLHRGASAREQGKRQEQGRRQKEPRARHHRASAPWIIDSTSFACLE